jgi:hypothetical protein
MASDSVSGDTVQVVVTILPVNDPPYVTSDTVDTATIGVLYSYIATVADPDDYPTFTYAGFPSWLRAAGDVLYGTPAPGTPDTSFLVIATDGELSDTVEVQLAVVTGTGILAVPVIPEFQHRFTLAQTEGEVILGIFPAARDPMTLTVYTISGSEAITRIILPAGTRSYTFKAPVSPGTYLVQAISGGMEFVQKVFYLR